jgi:transposase-like protein
MAVDRLAQCDNIVALAKELGISRRLLYTWREKLEPRESHGPPANAREATVRNKVSQLKRVLAETVLEVDFFKGALHTVEARRQRNGTAGAQASTPTSGM